MTHSSLCSSCESEASPNASSSFAEASSVSTASSKPSSSSLSSSSILALSFSVPFFSLSATCSLSIAPSSSLLLSLSADMLSPPFNFSSFSFSLDSLSSSFESLPSTDGLLDEDCPTGFSLLKAAPVDSSNNILERESAKDDLEFEAKDCFLLAVPSPLFCFSASFALRALAFSLRRLSSRAVPNMAMKPLRVLKNTSEGMTASSPKYVRRPVQASTASLSSADSTLSRTSAEMANWPMFVWARTELTSATKFLSPLPLAWR
mmetsp:Transcript_32155/g.94652  ORF Transcript_32155/g.94652 Transcript_32155/m.94652 type:complete len:262 (-) Transcript_32155:4713-5498(-)